MKYIFFFAITLVLAACQKLLYYEVVVENNTGYNIRIDGFYTEVVFTEEISDGVYEGAYNEVRSEVISIQPYGSYIYPQYVDREGGPWIQLFQEYPMDSVYIIFDSVRIIVQSCEDYGLELCNEEEVERNILSYDLNYEREDLGHKESRLIYKITNKDYERAKLIKN